MQRFSKTQAEAHLKRVFKALCVYAASEYSASAWGLVESGGFKALRTLNFDPSSYDSSTTSFTSDYLVYSFARKLEPLMHDPELKREAFRTFIRAELHCRRFNAEFRNRTEPNPRLESLISSAQLWIGKVLPDVGKCKNTASCRFGPGSTFSLHGEEANWENKIREDRISVTAASYGLARDLFNDPHLFEARTGILPEGEFSLLSNNFSIVSGSKLITVPKSSKTDRSICVEPSANIMLQKGVGRVLRKVLLRSGINLNDQGRNQRMAELALAQKYATIDLESASDTLCHGLVMELLPVDWYLYLDRLRSKAFTVDGTWFDFEKFSAMGNGFTFELESLIFYSLARACVPIHRHHEIAVFGDDIIIPQEYAPELMELLRYVGFIPNQEKSFLSGLFYESCGKHYFNGYDVTPIYQKEYPHDEAAIYRLANRIYRFTCRQYGDGPDTTSCPKDLRRAWLSAWRPLDQPILVPTKIEDDIGIMSTKAAPFSLKRKEGVYIRGLIPIARKIPVTDSAALAYTLRFQPSEPVSGLLSVRSRPRYRYGMRRFWTQF